MIACGASVANVKIRYYVVPKGRRSGIWRPTPHMRALGFRDVPCGPDGPAAWAIAEAWNQRWDAARLAGETIAAGPAEPATPEEAEAARRYPSGSVGAAWQRYVLTDEWRAKALSTRQKIWWPAWFRIRDMWGDTNPNLITFEMISAWRVAIRDAHGLDAAHKTIKVWRALWTVMRGLHIAIGDDPSLGVRNVAPKPRHQRWSEGEAVRLVKAAWRAGYRGLACIIAVSWDTLFSPVDVRTLRDRHAVLIDGRLVFDRSEEGRAKTGRPAYGTVSRRTERLVLAYLAAQGIERTPDAILFRMRAGGAYAEATLAHDFSAVRSLAFPGDRRQLRDMRRAGTVEIMAGRPEAGIVSAKLANSIERSNALHKTYAPVDLAQVQAADETRHRGRKAIRAGRSKVERLRP